MCPLLCCGDRMSSVMDAGIRGPHLKFRSESAWSFGIGPLSCRTFRGSQPFPSTHSILGRYQPKSREKPPVPPLKWLFLFPKTWPSRVSSFTSFVTGHQKESDQSSYLRPDLSTPGLLLILINCRQDPFTATGFQFRSKKQVLEKSPPLPQCGPILNRDDTQPTGTVPSSQGSCHLGLNSTSALTSSCDYRHVV